jgi:hypothetical protein
MDLQEALPDGRKYAKNYYRFFAKLIGGGLAAPGGKDTATFYAETDVLGMNGRNQLMLGGPPALRMRIAYLRDLMGLDLILMEVAQGGGLHE